MCHVHVGQTAIGEKRLRAEPVFDGMASSCDVIIGKKVNKNAYFKYQGKPLVHFLGSDVSKAAWQKFKQDLEVEILLIPGFNTVAPSPSFFNTYSSLDGIFSWNSWPSEG
ncbi:hypothetical protein VE01_01054 [Pseudogymnoascus verrucosus]|uniref:Uncharacterized protein n=1 Tax=Pseudogymnoascus verrucosus TaxID=342668 RepID=A0A1B8GY21_9PEZI|nr:uncharacterized protein VE01_01054 [Pseudogymnoascus verrucosus]OBU00707.1 hypothetical protein VE01_01054 [Pseudogymnoascus verrucosus]